MIEVMKHNHKVSSHIKSVETWGDARDAMVHSLLTGKRVKIIKSAMSGMETVLDSLQHMNMIGVRHFVTEASPTHCVLFHKSQHPSSHHPQEEDHRSLWSTHSSGRWGSNGWK